jgi:hypothetical protein
MSTSQTVPLGNLGPWSNAGDYNTIVYAIQGQLSKVQTATIVRVKACTNSGSLAPFGFVDVLPLVSQVAGDGTAVPHVTLFKLPYLRLQGGANAVIIDPQVGDLGIALFCNRDITSVVNTQSQSTPSSPRVFDWSDGLYLGGLLNSQPSQYLQFNSDGVSIVTPGGLQTQSAGDTDITASGDVNVTASGNVVLGGASIQAGSSPVPVVSQPFITWVTGTLIPALAAHSITVAPPPADSLTSTFEAS